MAQPETTKHSAKKTSFDLTTLVRRNILNMKPYSSARDEFKGEADVFLDANENPFPSPYNRYPDPLQLRVKEKLSKIKQVQPDQTFLGNGSDEAIDLLIRAFCEPNIDAILITEPTYGMYAVCAAVNAVQVQRVNLTSTFDIDLDASPESFPENLKIIFLCSPNNPSGNLMSREKVVGLLNRFNGLVVVDEAYIDFAPTKSFTEALPLYPNLVVLQTFSKAWGLAGLRLGMCFASPEIIRVLNKIKYPYNVNIRTQEIALEALNNVDKKNEWVDQIIKERHKMVESLLKLPITQMVYPSDANFLLVKVNEAFKTYQYLMNEGIIVRDRSTVILCDNCLRITIGTPMENEKLILELSKLKA